MAGVHPATASRALNQATESLVNAETAARIKKVAAEMGYSPNPIARSLKTSRSASIGLVIPDLTNPLFPPIVRGVEDVLRPIGYNAWIVNTDNRPDVEKAAVESFRQRNVEGWVERQRPNSKSAEAARRARESASTGQDVAEQATMDTPSPVDSEHGDSEQGADS